MQKLPLKTWRVDAGLSQQQAAIAAGLSPCTISQFETGRAQPSLSTLRRLARLYRIQAPILGAELLRDGEQAQVPKS